MALSRSAQAVGYNRGMRRSARTACRASFLILTLAASPSNASIPTAAYCCPILELRQYTLHPGKRDDLVELFDREFVETQEAVGMTIVGQFRDLTDSTRFVWVRGFRDMPSRAKALTAFYGGPVWKAHREAAIATMVDADNVLLLRPARPGSGFSAEGRRPSLDGDAPSASLVTATIYQLEPGTEASFANFFEATLKPRLEGAGAKVLGFFVSEKGANTYPSLPVREDANVFVWFARFSDSAGYDAYAAAFARSGADELARRVKGRPEVLKLSPTKRSQLR